MVGICHAIKGRDLRLRDAQPRENRRQNCTRSARNWRRKEISPAGDAGRAALDRLTAKTRSGKNFRPYFAQNRRAIPAPGRYFDLADPGVVRETARRAAGHRDAVII